MALHPSRYGEKGSGLRGKRKIAGKKLRRIRIF